jgi:hypothetical protein
MDQALRQMSDVSELRQLLARYCRAVSRCDPELLKSVYHPDATDGHFEGSAWEWAEALCDEKNRVNLRGIRIVLASEYFELHGESAAGEIAFIVYRLSKDDTLQTTWGRYLDRYQRRDGDWRIFERSMLHDWTRQEHIDGHNPLSLPLAQGSVDKDDLSYEWLANG